MNETIRFSSFQFKHTRKKRTPTVSFQIDVIRYCNDKLNQEQLFKLLGGQLWVVNMDTLLLCNDPILNKHEPTTMHRYNSLPHQSLIWECIVVIFSGDEMTRSHEGNRQPQCGGST